MKKHLLLLAGLMILAPNGPADAKAVKLGRGSAYSVAADAKINTGAGAQMDTTKKCDSSCTTCDTTTGKCIGCPSGKRPDAARCVDNCYNVTCKDGYTTKVTSDGCCCESTTPTCMAGTYLSGSSCVNCSAGTYSAAGATSCTKCPAGTFSDEEGSSVCTKCPARTYSNAGSSGCLICPAGTYSAGGVSVCTTCPAGTYSRQAASVCTKCSAGTYSAAGASSCTTCPAGEYSAAGASSCTTCPTGYTSYAGSSSCTLCATGYTMNEITGECMKLSLPVPSSCPANTQNCGSTGCCPKDNPCSYYAGMGAAGTKMCYTINNAATYY